jgi:hypothetical protein
MTRKLNILGLLVVALALGALGASSAQAANFFHSHIGEKNPDQVIITGENKIGEAETVSPHVFTFAPGSKAIVCKVAKHEGTEDAGVRVKDEELDETEKPLPFTHENATTKVKTITGTSLTLTATYSECEVPSIGAATVTNNGCHTRFTAETSVEEHGGVHLECGATGSIVIKASTCEITIKSQTVNKGAHYTNTGETRVAGKLRDIDLKTTLTGMSFTTNKNLVCLSAKIPNEGKEGTYEGELTVKAFEDLNKTENKGKTGVYEEGKQLDAWWGPTI